MTIFKIGDRVKYVGKLGTVTDIFLDGIVTQVAVTFDDGSFCYGSYAENLELYEEEPQIKVGSKWRMKDDKGFVATVDSICADGQRLVYATDDLDVKIKYLIKDWLTFMEPVPETEESTTKSIITETTVRTVKAGVYGDVRVVHTVFKDESVFLKFEKHVYSKQTLNDLIETLKQIHEVM